MASTPSSEQLTVLLLGSGGREHALAWKLSRSPRLRRLVCAPGNPGMAGLGEQRSILIENGDAVVQLAREVGADLVVVGPEAPLAAGVADALDAAGIAVFGPSRGAARLEWDKVFSKDFMIRHGIPTASSQSFTADQIDEGGEYLRHHSIPIVLKASGLAAGKGVVIATSVDEAIETLGSMLSGKAFGSAGEQVVVEEFMQGEEASVFALCDGERYLLLPASQDHKRVGDDDTGPNTGGMGAYAPAPLVSPELADHIARTIIEPTLKGMREEGSPYRGCLFVGLMIDNGTARVVEFNSRFGDPETQVILPLIDIDLVEAFHAAATGCLPETKTLDVQGSAVCVVMASGGYPGSYRKGDAISGIDQAESIDGTVVFHAGTRFEDGQLLTNGGRVLGVTAMSESSTLDETIQRAYEAVEKISFADGFYRHDIGRKGMGVGV